MLHWRWSTASTGPFYSATESRISQFHFPHSPRFARAHSSIKPVALSDWYKKLAIPFLFPLPLVVTFVSENKPRFLFRISSWTIMAHFNPRRAHQSRSIVMFYIFFLSLQIITTILFVTAHAAPPADIHHRPSLNLAVLRQTSCPLGSIPTFARDKQTCVPCLPGYFHRGIYTKKCEPCPKNTFNAFIGGVTRKACRPCGMYSVSDKASTSCTHCKPGSVAVRASACVSCPPGSALPIRGTKCRSCAAGFYSSVRNSQHCEPCPRGTTSNEARTACIFRPCPPGQEWLGHSCISCGPNRYRNGTMEACEACPLRTIPDANRASCVFCRPGTQIVNMFLETFSRSCESCPANLTTVGESKPVCAVSTNTSSNPACSQYTFRDADGDCNRCARDEYLMDTSDGGRVCAPCPKGAWSAGGIPRSCIACGKDQIMLPPSSIQSLGDSRHITRCSCPDGHVVSDAYARLWNRPDLSKVEVCTKCPAGTYKGTGELRCEPCASDEFSKAGSSVCEKCPDGMYSLPKMGASCVPFPSCPTGYTVRDSIDGCVRGATGCPIGSKLQLVGSGKSARVGACVRNSGKIACTGGTVYDGVGACIKCNRGFYLSSDLANVPGTNGSDATVPKWFCKQCPYGTFSDKENAYRCKSCPIGFLGTQDRCLCDVGYYIDQLRLTCRLCTEPFPYFRHFDCSLSTFLHPWIDNTVTPSHSRWTCMQRMKGII